MGKPHAELTVIGGADHRGMQRAPGESRLRPVIVPADTTTRHFQRVRRGQTDDNYVYEFVVQNPRGPICVWNTTPDGVRHTWPHRETAPGEVTFYPHETYTGGGVWFFHGHETRSEAMYEEPKATWGFLGAASLIDHRGQPLTGATHAERAGPARPLETDPGSLQEAPDDAAIRAPQERPTDGGPGA